MKFYTNVSIKKNIITEFWIDEEGKRRKTTCKFRPKLALPTDKKTNYYNIYGKNLGVIEFDSCMEMYSWKKENKNYSNIYNDVEPIYQYISEKYSEKISADYSKLRIFNIDIEVISDEGFPFADTASYPINSIVVQDYYKDVFFVFGTKPYKEKEKNVKYFLCDDEFDLCSKFLDFFRRSRPDILTGFNIEDFDVPYIINRFKQVLPEGEYYKLSPLNEIKAKMKDGKVYSYNIVGVSQLDFLNLYKDMNLKKLEAYSLENIAQEELGEGKLDFKELGYKNHYEFYHGDYQKFIDYNIQDVNLVTRINKKKRFIQIVLSQAYMAKVNYEDALGSVKPWDVYVYNELKKRNILPSPKPNPIRTHIPGGFVLPPKPGIHEWMLVSDIASSYPHQIINGNLSPETIVDSNLLPEELKEIQKVIKREFWGTKEKTSTGFIDVDNIEKLTSLLKKHNLCMSANGEFFTTEKYGIFPEIVSDVYEGRKLKKKEMKEYWSKMKKVDKESEEYKILENKYAAADNEQYALKIFMNSFYGVFSNPYFRYNDSRLASAVTTNGQMCIKGPKKYIEDKFPLISIDYTDTDSCRGDTEIITNHGRYTIEELWNKSVNKQQYRSNVDVGELPNMTALSLNKKTKENEQKTITYISKHKVNKKMYELEVEGRTVVITEDHSIMIKRKNQIISSSPANIRETDEIIFY